MLWTMSSQVRNVGEDLSLATYMLCGVIISSPTALRENDPFKMPITRMAVAPLRKMCCWQERFRARMALEQER